MANAAELQGGIRFIGQPGGVPQQQCSGKGHRVFRKQILQQYPDLLPQPGRIQPQWQFYPLAHRHIRLLISQQEGSLPCIIAGLPASAGAGAAQAERAPDRIPQRQHRFPVQIQADRDLLFPHLKASVGADAVITGFRGCGNLNGQDGLHPIQLLQRFQPVLLKAAPP